MSSLSDIAEKLDVSVSLVSKVLNNRLGTTGVRKDLAESIRQCAAEIGYQKNTSAVALLQGRHNVIGVFMHQVGTSGSGVTEAIVQGFSSAATQAHQRLILDFFTCAEDFLAYRDFTHRAMMDGLLIGGLSHQELVDDLLEIRGSGLPIVTLHEEQLHRQLPNVALDEVEIGRIATEHLIEQGSRNIAHIVDFADRTKGYRKALKAHDIPFTAKLMYEDGRPEFSYAKGRRAAQHFLASGVAFDGLVAQSDEEALGAMHALMDEGLRIPDEVRIIGVDDAPYCMFSRVPLSSVSQNGEERGKIAMRMLLAQINDHTVKSKMVPPVLRARQSTGVQPR